MSPKRHIYDIIIRTSRAIAANRWAVGVWFLMFVTALGWRYACVPYGDDFMYSHEYTIVPSAHGERYQLGSHISTSEQLAQSVKLHYLTNNGRLSNALAFAVISGPRWLDITLCALAVSLLPLLVLLVAGGWRLGRSPGWLIGVGCLMWIALPWSDHMQSTDFMLNYAVSGCAMLGVILLTQHPERLGTSLRMGCAIAYTILGCWMHEGFTIPTIAYIVATMALDRTWRGRRALLLAGAAAGLLACVSIGTLSRLSSINAEGGGWWFNWGILAGYRMPWVFCALGGIALCRRQRLSSDTRRHLASLTAAIAVSLAMIITLNASERALWCPITLSMAGSVAIIHSLWHMSSRRRQSAITWSLVVVYTAFMVNLTYWQDKAGDDYRAINPLLSASTDNIVFADIPGSERRIPWTAMRIPVDYRYNDYINLLFENWVVTGDTLLPIIAPERFRGLPVREWDKVRGANPFYGTPDILVSTRDMDGRRAIITVGRPDRRMNPLNRALMTLIPGDNDHCEVTFESYFSGVYRGDSLYYNRIPQIRRLQYGREILSIDTLQ